MNPNAAPAPPALPEWTGRDFEVSEDTQRWLLDGVPANTRRAYTRQWDQFAAWCAENGRTPLPATGETVAEYVTHLCGLRRAPATIAQALTAIRVRHRLVAESAPALRAAGHHDAADRAEALHGRPSLERARLVLRGYRRHRAESGRRNTRTAPPITIDALRAMVDTCDDSLRGLRDRVVLVLGLALMGRRSELVALDLGDVIECDEGLCVFIRASKTDVDAEGIDVSVPYGQHPQTCPVRVVRAWTDALAAHDITTGRLLRSLPHQRGIGGALGAEAVSAIVRARARAAGLPHAEAFTAHSLRAGGATVAATHGAPMSAIAAHGRWSEKSPVVYGYVRAADKWRDNPMRGVGL